MDDNDEDTIKCFIDKLQDFNSDENTKLEAVNRIKYSQLFQVASNVQKIVSALTTRLAEANSCFGLKDAIQDLNHNHKNFTIDDCKRFVINIIQGTISIVQIFKLDEGTIGEPKMDQECLRAFSGLLKSLIKSMVIFSMPSISDDLKDETHEIEHDALTHLAKMFFYFNSSELHKIFSPNIDILVSEIRQYPSLQIFLQSLLSIDTTARDITELVLNYILNHLEDIDDVDTYPILMSLFDSVCLSLRDFPENADILEIFLLPMVNECMPSVLSAKKPCKFLKFMEAIFTFINLENFQSEISQSLLPQLPSMLEFLESWYRTAPYQLIKDQIIALCLTISRTCTPTIQMDNLPVILMFVVEAVSSNSLHLIQKGLEGLQNLDYLDKEFLESDIPSLKPKLIQGLLHASKISTNCIDEVAIQFLSKFYDPQHNCQNQMKCESSITEGTNISFNMFQKEMHQTIVMLPHEIIIPIPKVMKSIFQLLQSNYTLEISTPISDSLLKECFHIIKCYLASSIDQDSTYLLSQLLTSDFISDSKGLNLTNKSLEYFPSKCAPLKSWNTQRVTLTNLFALTSCTEMVEFQNFFEKCVVYYTVLAVTDEHHLGAKEDGVGTFVIVDAIVEFLSCFSDSDVGGRQFLITGIKALEIILQTCEKILGYEKLWKLSLIQYMMRSVCSLCCRIPWHFKLVQNIFTSKLFKLNKNRSEDQHLQLILESVSPHINSPYGEIRSKIAIYLTHLAKRLLVTFDDLLKSYKVKLPDFIELNEFLNCASTKCKIYAIFDFAFYMELPSVITFDLIPDCKVFCETVTCLCNNVFDNMTNISKNHIDICKVTIRAFRHMPLAYFTEFGVINILIKALRCETPKLSVTAFHCLKAIKENKEDIWDSGCISALFSSFEDYSGNYQIHYLSYLLFLLRDIEGDTELNIIKEIKVVFIYLLKQSLSNFQRPEDFSQELKLRNKVKHIFYWLPETIEGLKVPELVHIFLEAEISLRVKDLFLKFLNTLFHRYHSMTLDLLFNIYPIITDPEERLHFTYCLEYLLDSKCGEVSRCLYEERPYALVKNIPDLPSPLEEFFNAYLPLIWMLFGGDNIFRLITCGNYSVDEILQSVFSSPNETTYSAIRIIYSLYRRYNVRIGILIEILRIIWLYIDIHGRFPSTDHKDEYEQLAYLLLEGYKSSRDAELLFIIFMAPIDHFPEHFTFVVDFLKTEVSENSTEYKKILFLQFLQFHYAVRFDSSVKARIVDFVIVPSFLSSMKNKEFEAIIVGSDLNLGIIFRQQLMHCFHILKNMESNLQKSLLQFSCIMLECACHYNSNVFVKALERFIKTNIQVQDENFHPVTKGYWNLFWSYLFKITKVQRNEERIPKLLKKCLKSHDPVLRETSRYGLDILIPVISSKKDGKSAFTHWVKEILEDKNYTSYLSILEHILPVVVSHYRHFEMNPEFVGVLDNAALILLNTSVFEYKKLSVDVMETILKCTKELYSEGNESSKEEYLFKENMELVARFLFKLTCIHPLGSSDEELSRKSLDILKNSLDFCSFVDFGQWLDAKTCPLDKESEQLCREWVNIINIIHPNTVLRNYLNAELNTNLDMLNISLDLHTFVDLEALCCAKIKDLDDLSICNGLELLQHLLTKYRVDIFQLVVKNIRKIMRFFFKTSKEVVEACKELFKKVLELSGNESFNQSPLVKSCADDLHRFIDAFLKNFVWKPEVPNTNDVSEAMDELTNGCMAPSDEMASMDWIKRVSDELLQYCGTFIDRCELQSKGWVVWQLVASVYPVPIDSYAEILKRVINDHLNENMDHDGHDNFLTDENKLAIALDAIEVASGKIIFDENVEDLWSDLIKNTNSSKILMSIISIIKKWFICCYHEISVQKYLPILRKISTRIRVDFQNDVQVCLIYCEAIELLCSYSENENHGYQLFWELMKDIHSEIPEIQQKFFKMFHSLSPKEGLKRMKLLLSNEYWGSVAFSAVNCIEMMIPCIKEAPLKNDQSSVQSSENVEEIFAESLQKAELQTVLNDLQLFKNDLREKNTSSFFRAIKKLCEFDDTLAQALWTELFSKLWKFTIGHNEMEQELVIQLRDFVKTQISVNKERSNDNDLIIFPENSLSFTETPLPSQWFLESFLLSCHDTSPLHIHQFCEFIGYIPGLSEKVCQHLEDSVLKSTFSNNIVCDTCLALLSKAYSRIDGDILSGLLQQYSKSPELCTGFEFQQQGYTYKALEAYESAMEQFSQEPKTTKFQVIERGVLEKQRIECAKELGQWKNFDHKIKDGGLVNVDQDEIEVFLTSHSLQCLEDETELSSISCLIKDALSLCIKMWKTLPQHTLTPKHYTLLQARKKILEFEKALILPKHLLSDLKSCSTGLKDITKAWNPHIPSINDNPSFWKEIHSFRSDLLQFGVKLLQKNNILKKIDIQNLTLAVDIALEYSHKQLMIASLQGFQSPLQFRESSMAECSNLELQVLKLDENNYLKYLFRELDFHKGNRQKCIELLNRGLSFQHHSSTKKREAMKCVFSGLILSMQVYPNAEQLAKQKFQESFVHLDDWAQGWHECGSFFQKLFSSNPQRYDYYRKALECFIRACKYENERGSVEELANIIWLLSFSYHDTSLSLQNVLNMVIEHIPTYYWLPWIPQLLSIFVKATHNHLLPLLRTIGTKYPESLYFSIQSLLTEIHPSIDGTEHPKYKPCQEIMENLKKMHPLLTSTLQKIVNEFLELSKNCRPDMLLVLKEIEVKICNLFSQSYPNLDYINNKIKEILFDSVFELSDVKVIEDLLVSRNFESLNDVMREISKCRKYYEAEKKKINRAFELVSQSKFLSAFPLCHEKIKMFSNPYEQKECDVYISRFLSQVEIVDRHGMHACRVYIEGHDGMIYPYLIMSSDAFGKTIKKERRVYQLFSFLNPVLSNEKETYTRSLKYKVPAIISIHPCVKITEDNVSSNSLLDIVNKHCSKVQQRRDIFSSSPSSQYELHNGQKSDPNVQQPFMMEAFDLIPKHLVRGAILKEFPNNYLQFRRNLCRNIALSVVSQYFFYLTEQVPENICIDPYGNITVFGLTFKTHELKSDDADSSYVENESHLQADIVELMTPIEKSGYGKLAMLSVARCFKLHQEEIESLVKSILLEEIEDFHYVDRQKLCHVVQAISEKIEAMAEFDGSGVLLDVLLNERM